MHACEPSVDSEKGNANDNNSAPQNGATDNATATSNKETDTPASVKLQISLESIVHIGILAQLVMQHLAEELSVESFLSLFDFSTPAGVTSYEVKCGSAERAEKRQDDNNDITAFSFSSKGGVTTSVVKDGGRASNAVVGSKRDPPAARWESHYDQVLLSVKYKNLYSCTFHIAESDSVVDRNEVENRLKLGIANWIKQVAPDDFWVLVSWWVNAMVVTHGHAGCV